MRILVAFGTRPEIIKLGPVCRALSRRQGAVVDVFWTGQHIELAAGLLEFFEIEVGHSGSDVLSEPGLAGKFAQIARQIEARLRAERYDWIVVQGDTTTAAAQRRRDFSPGSRSPMSRRVCAPATCHRHGRRNSTAAS